MLHRYPASQLGHPAKAVQRHPRILFSTPIMLHHLVPGGVRFTNGISLDISEGGLGRTSAQRLASR